MCDLVRDAFLKECKRRNIHVSVKPKPTVKKLANLLHEHAKKLHKKKRTLGRVARLTKKALQKACKKNKIEYKSYDTEDELKKRLKGETSSRVKCSILIGKASSPANDVQKVLGLKPGEVVCFKNNTYKQLLKCKTGGFRWKSVE